MLTVSEALSRNRILTGLPTAERHSIQQVLEVSKVNLGDVLDRLGGPVAYLYFPVDAPSAWCTLRTTRTHSM
ncbi:MAG TPA: hypothetical protein VLC51_10175 [Nitrospira sp.]|nr:hypothetical protein [Nitrospira sp.]